MAGKVVLAAALAGRARMAVQAVVMGRVRWEAAQLAGLVHNAAHNRRNPCLMSRRHCSNLRRAHRRYRRHCWWGRPESKYSRIEG